MCLVPRRAEIVSSGQLEKGNEIIHTCVNSCTSNCKRFQIVVQAKLRKHVSFTMFPRELVIWSAKPFLKLFASHMSLIRGLDSRFVAGRLSSTVLKFMVSFLCFVIDKAFKNNTACSSATIDS